MATDDTGFALAGGNCDRSREICDARAKATRETPPRAVADLSCAARQSLVRPSDCRATDIGVRCLFDTTLLECGYVEIRLFILRAVSVPVHHSQQRSERRSNCCMSGQATREPYSTFTIYRYPDIPSTPISTRASRTRGEVAWMPRGLQDREATVGSSGSATTMTTPPRPGIVGIGLVRRGSAGPVRFRRFQIG